MGQLMPEQLDYRDAPVPQLLRLSLVDTQIGKLQIFLIVEG